MPPSTCIHTSNLCSSSKVRFQLKSQSFPFFIWTVNTMMHFVSASLICSQIPSILMERFAALLFVCYFAALGCSSSNNTDRSVWQHPHTPCPFYKLIRVLFSDLFKMSSRCLRVLEHRDLHVETETVQPGDVCGFARVGGRRYEVSLWCGRSYPVAGWAASYWPRLLSLRSYHGVPWGFWSSWCCDTELF